MSLAGQNLLKSILMLLSQKHNKAVNERQQAGWTALSAASQQSCPLPQRYTSQATPQGMKND